VFHAPALATKGCRIAPHLHMRPFPAAGRADIALVEPCRNCVVARCPGPHDLINDRPHIGGKPRAGAPAKTVLIP
jgi:hypothetical protein